MKERTANIDEIMLMTPREINEKFGGKLPEHDDGKPLAAIIFKFPCKWTTLTIDELMRIIKCWIIAEEIRYPPANGYEGRGKLFRLIQKTFDEV